MKVCSARSLGEQQDRHTNSGDRANPMLDVAVQLDPHRHINYRRNSLSPGRTGDNLSALAKPVKLVA